MTKGTFKITNELGLHARAAAQLVKVASHYKAEISIEKGRQKVNGKSIMGILMLAAARGSEVTITAEGEDASEAIKDLEKLIHNKFGEK